MPIHRGADVLYQNSLATLNAEDAEVVTLIPPQVPAPPENVTQALTAALVLQQLGETLSAKVILSTTVGGYSYYAAVSSLGRACIFVNGTGGSDPTMLGPDIQAFPTE